MSRPAILAGVAVSVLCGLISAPTVAAATTAQKPATAASAGASVASSRTTTPTPAEIARRKYEQTRPQKEVPFNPADFDKFVGYYRFADTDNFAHVYRTGKHYFSQLTGQPPVEFFPESPTKFFTTVVAAQMSFVIGPDGRVTGMVIHQNGLLHPLQRVSEAQFEAGSAALAKRIEDNTPSPGTRAMVLAYIKELEQGRQDYSTMTPQLAAVSRPQLAKAVELVRKQGALKSLTFARVAPNGANVYTATFAHGKLLWVIMPLSKDGKVTGVFFRPFSP